MKRIAFIDIGPGGIQYFHELAQRMEHIDAIFYSTRPKVRSMLTQLGGNLFSDSGSRGGRSEVGLPRDLLQYVVSPKSALQYGDGQQLQQIIQGHYWKLRELFDSFRPDAIVIWNGSGLVAMIALYLARKQKLITLFGENGYFHNTMQLDPEGVNFTSSFTRTIGDDYSMTIVEPGRLHALRELIRQSSQGGLPPYEPPRKRIRASLWSKLMVETNKLSWKRMLSPRLGLEQAGEPPAALPERYIFLPFQVTFDSQLLLYSPLIGNDMSLFVRRCHEAVSSVAPGHKLVVKLHPAESSSVDYRELIRAFPDVVWLGRYPIKQALESAELIITINSTVGLEGLMANKPVITLGQNFYNVPGIVQHLTSLDQLPEAIRMGLSQPADSERIEQFLYHVYYNCFTHGNKRNFSEQSFRAVAEKIRQLISD